MSIVRIGFCVAVLTVISPTLATACPALEGFYPGPEAEWEPLQSRLREIFDQCLESTEYFALLGAAELNVGNLLESLEALERSLLLDPDNGAALIDYAEALMLDGQLFAALEIHTILEDRDDVPEELMSQLVQRRIEWQKLTKQTVWQAELGGGHDRKLNVWFENHVMITAIYEINKNTELDDDWQWLQDNCFEFKNFYKLNTVEFVYLLTLSPSPLPKIVRNI